MYCWKCGNKLRENAKFCNKCGANIFGEKTNNITNLGNYSKTAKVFMIVLFIITIISLWIAMISTLIFMGNVAHHGLAFIKNSWLMWCFLPIPILSIILGFKYKKRGLKCTKNIVGGFIIAFFMFIYGSFCLFPSFSEDYNKIYEYKDIINAQLPSNGYLEIIKWNVTSDSDITEYTSINAYYDNEDTSNFEKSIENNSNWILSNEVKSELKVLIPNFYRYDKKVYYSIYNKTTNEYNRLPSESGKYEIYSMSYHIATKTLEISKFKYDYK